MESQGHINESQHQQFLSMLLAMEDVPAVLIVLADRLQQLRSQPGDKTAAREALDVFAPLANRLGVWSIKAELEDLAFKVLAAAPHFHCCLSAPTDPIHCGGHEILTAILLSLAFYQVEACRTVVYRTCTNPSWNTILGQRNFHIFKLFLSVGG